MSENLCIRCGRPTPDGYVCGAETDRAAAQLAEIRDMTPAARDIATGQARRSGAGGSGKPGSRLPLDLAATARLDAVERELGTWLRHVAEERGAGQADIGRDDTIEGLTEKLAQHLEWFRHRPEVDEFLTDLDACARVVRGLARGPAAQRYLGPCGAIRPCEGLDEGEWPQADCGNHVVHASHDRECDGDIYARETASVGRCRICGAEVASEDRRAWLDAQARSHAFRAAQIAEAYGINVKTIRSWADRGHLVAHGHDGEGRPLYNVGDVLDLAAGDAARREEARAKRARRAAAKAAESEEAA